MNTLYVALFECGCVFMVIDTQHVDAASVCASWRHWGYDVQTWTVSEYFRTGWACCEAHPDFDMRVAQANERLVIYGWKA